MASASFPNPSGANAWLATHTDKSDTGPHPTNGYTSWTAPSTNPTVVRINEGTTTLSSWWLRFPDDAVTWATVRSQGLVAAQVVFDHTFNTPFQATVKMYAARGASITNPTTIPELEALTPTTANTQHSYQAPYSAIAFPCTAAVDEVLTDFTPTEIVLWCWVVTASPIGTLNQLPTANNLSDPAPTLEVVYGDTGGSGGGSGRGWGMIPVG